MGFRLLGLASLLIISLVPSSCSDDDGGGRCGWLIEGRCGMLGRCVQCNTDEDCMPDLALYSYGTRESRCTTNSDCQVGSLCINHNCVHGSYCTIYGECLDFCPPTGSLECPDGTTCVKSRCLQACRSDYDCLEGIGTCLPEGYCKFIWCSEGLNCESGYEGVPKTLVCRPLID